MPTWLDFMKSKQDSEEANKKKEQDDLELKTVTEKLGNVDSIETELKTMKDESTKVNTRLTSFLDEQEAMKRRRIAEEAVKKANETKESEDKEMETLWLENPQEAAKKTFERESAGLTTATINTQSQLLRKNIFDDNPDKFEYYDKSNPEFKSSVDSMIDNLPLNQRTNPEAIKNCYAVAAFNKSQEIKEGKLKSRFAATSTSSTGNASTKDKDTVTLTELQKAAAKAFGISEEDYGKQAKEMNYV